MDNSKASDSHAHLSRRNFLKVATGGLIGTFLAGVSAEDVSAATQSPDIAANPGKGQSETYTFKDALGREMPLQKKTERVIPSGIYAQAVLCTLCPEKIAAVTAEIAENEREQYRRSGRGELCELPQTGGLYSTRKRDINTSAVANIDAELVIDIGVNKSDLKFSLDYLQINTDTSTAFVDASFGQLPATYRTLGKLLDCSSRAEVLASYIENIHTDIGRKRGKVEKAPEILFAGNELGLSTHKSYSFQNKAIEFVGGVPVTVPTDSLSGEMDKEALQEQSIDYVLFNDRSCFESVLNGEGRAYEIWSSVPAIQAGNYAVAPILFHSWLNSPLLIQIIGLPWLGKLIWPSVYDYNLVEITQEFYELFFGYGLSNDKALELLGYELNMEEERI